jgi:hypothetical protein
MPFGKPPSRRESLESEGDMDSVVPVGPNRKTTRAGIAALFVSGLPGCPGSVPEAPSTPSAAVAAESPPEVDDAELAMLHGGRNAVRLKDGRVLVAGGEHDHVATDRVDVFDPKAGAWVKGPPMSVPRRDHAVALLRDGSVWVVGGDNAQMPAGADPNLGRTLESTEVFDPRTGAWRAGAPMRNPRKRHTATTLEDGRVLVVGEPDSELFDPVKNSWSEPIPTTVPLAGHTATLLRDGKVLVVGAGGNPRRAVAEVFDPATSSWTSAPAPAHGLTDHAATLLAEGTVLVVGGLTAPTGHTWPLSFATVFEPKRGRWNLTGQPKSAHWKHAGLVLRSGDVLISGGAKGEPELYTKEIWRPVPPSLKLRYERTRLERPAGAPSGDRR